MNTFLKSTAAALVGAILAAGHAMADGLICERAVSFAAGELPGAERTFYAHGCDRFQYQPLTAGQVANLGEHCTVGEFGAQTIMEEEYVVVRERRIPYGVADGSIHHRDNLTSMGASATTGEQVLRVRSATDGNPVSIRRAGGGVVWSGTVGRGDTFVSVGQSGTYIATTGSRTITKATGPQTFNDTTTIEVFVDDASPQYQAGIPLCDEPQIIRQ